MSTPKKFIKGDLVLVKFLEYGYWPAKITRVNKNGYRRFICFGDNSNGNAHVKDIMHYDDSFKMKQISQSSVDKYPDLSEALEQISVESQNRNKNNKEDLVYSNTDGIKVEDQTIIIDDEGSLENTGPSSNTSRNSSITNHQMCSKCDHDPGTISIKTNGPGSNAENNVKIRVDIEIPMDIFNQVAPEVFDGLARCRSSPVITQPMAKQMVNYPEGDRKLFVGGLASQTTNDDLVEYFEKFGVVENADVAKEKMTGRSKGFAFVLFKTPEGLANATVKTSHVINGRVCKVGNANKKPGKVYNANKKPGKVYVGKLPATGVKKYDIQEYFEKYGKVTEISQPIDWSKNEPKNFCFVTFDNEDIAKNLVERGTCTIKGHSMQIKEVVEKAGGRGCYEAQRLVTSRGSGFGGLGAGGRMERAFGRDGMGGGYGNGMGGGYGNGMGGGYGNGIGGGYGDGMGGGYGDGMGGVYGYGMGRDYGDGMMDGEAGGSGMGRGYGDGRKMKGGKRGIREMPY